jgi:hypothetical protein
MRALPPQGALPTHPLATPKMKHASICIALAVLAARVAPQAKRYSSTPLCHATLREKLCDDEVLPNIYCRKNLATVEIIKMLAEKYLT